MQTIDTKIARDIWQEIEKANRILLHAHPNPDADSLGSTLAMKFALESRGKLVTLIKGDSDLPKYLEVLPGYNTITLKNFFEINLNDFDLFLILDTGGPDRISKLQPITFPLPIRSVVIDHHITNTKFADINLVAADYPATCQILFDLFEMWGIPVTKEMALCLFTGIYTDTGGFVFRQTTSQTLDVAAKLADIAPEFVDVLFALFNSNTKGYLKLKGILYNSIKTYFSDRVAVAAVSHEELRKNNIDKADMSIDVANDLKSVVGWDIAVRLIEDEEGIVKLSFRTRDQDKYDVSKIALKLGGGGHKSASGARISGTVENAEQKLLQAIAETYPELGNP
jgi:phosphoesterase RecJ-like protein